MTSTQQPVTFDGMHDWFRSMRESTPVTLDQAQGIAHTFGYRETFTVLTEYGDFSSYFGGVAPQDPDFALFAKGNFIGMDPPDHHNLRGLVSRVFTPKMVAGLAPRIAAVTRELLAAVDGEFDLVSELAYPLPVIVIAELLGIPSADRTLFRRWADALLSQQIGDDAVFDEARIAALAPTIREMNAYLLAHIKNRRANPGDDLTSLLTTAEADGRRLTDTEIVGFVGVLLIAGHITTTALLGNSVLIMHERTDIAAELRADRSLIPAAIEEFLRVRSPFSRVPRRTTRELEIGGISLPENQIVFGWVASANRDGAQFADPDSVDIHRAPNHHLAFGKGIHFCIGAPLARLEARVALNHLLDTYRTIEVGEGTEFFPAYTIAAAKRLPVHAAR